MYVHVGCGGHGGRSELNNTARTGLLGTYQPGGRRSFVLSRSFEVSDGGKVQGKLKYEIT